MARNCSKNIYIYIYISPATLICNAVTDNRYQNYLIRLRNTDEVHYVVSGSVMHLKCGH